MGEKVAMVQNWFSGMKSSLDYMLDTLCLKTFQNKGVEDSESMSFAFPE